MTNKTIALVGNANCGKTTLFNALTGSNYDVGNRIGVTIEKRAGICKYNKNILIVDLPGTYSLTPNSSEEVITSDFLLNTSPDLILNIVDATNLKRNFYLTSELTQLNIPIVIALNMTDVAEKNGIILNTSKLSEKLNIPVVAISAKKKTGIDILIKECLSKKQKSIPPQNYSRILSILQNTTSAPEVTNQLKTTLKTDEVALHKYLAIPLFLLTIFVIFQITFSTFGTFMSDITDKFFKNFILYPTEEILIKCNVNTFFKGLIIDGIFTGIGSVISFLPELTLLFFFMSVLEDTGYMARIAFLTDSLFMKIGLTGKSFIPMIMSFGCNASSVFTLRTLENKRDKALTALLLPFMSCSAKIPVYSVFTSAFFPKYSGIIIFCLYLTGILLSLISGFILSNIIPKNRQSLFLLEMPPYRMITLSSTLKRIRTNLKEFMSRIMTVLVLASIIIWILQNLDMSFKLTANGEQSIIGTIGKIISPIFVPCGFGNWKSSVALISGIIGKEFITSTLSILSTSPITSSFTPLSASSFMIFVLLYTPCIATLTAIYNELKSKKLVFFSIIYHLSIAYICSMIVFQLGNILT